jgi:hypothetical protein
LEIVLTDVELVFAPGFIASVFRGEYPAFTLREDVEHLLDGLRMAGLPE